MGVTKVRAWPRTEKEQAEGQACLLILLELLLDALVRLERLLVELATLTACHFARSLTPPRGEEWPHSTDFCVAELLGQPPGASPLGAKRKALRPLYSRASGVSSCLLGFTASQKRNGNDQHDYSTLKGRHNGLREAHHKMC